MSYSILYHKRKNHTNKYKRPILFIAFVLCITLLCVGSISGDTLVRHCFPVFAPEVRAAFANMLDRIYEGIPVGKAAVTFGQEILQP